MDPVTIGIIVAGAVAAAIAVFVFSGKKAKPENEFWGENVGPTGPINPPANDNQVS